MVTCPKPNDPANSFTVRWDAWNRLVKVLDGANTVAEYEYDGMNRRIVKKTYTSGSLTETRHDYHAPSQNQVLEERVGSSTSAERQYTWNPGYIDSLLLRKRDTNADGTLDEILYPLTDITYDVVALTDATGTVVERFLYDPYGKGTVLDANFAVDSDGISDYDWEYRFTSREFDKETGLDYFPARPWGSHFGQFLGRDPLEYPDGMNAYAGYFVPNSTDPYGKSRNFPLSPEEYLNWVVQEGDKRRGNGPWKDSAQHCWIACHVGLVWGAGSLAALVGDIGEFDSPSKDTPRDINAQHYGGLWGDFYHYSGMRILCPYENAETRCDQICKTFSK